MTSRNALRFLLSKEGTFFRNFLLDEVVKSIDALSRDAAATSVASVGLGSVVVPMLLPGAKPFVPLSPDVTEEDVQQIENVQKMVAFFTERPADVDEASMDGNGDGDGDGDGDRNPPRRIQDQAQLLLELAPLLPELSREVLPELNRRLAERVGARLLRDVYLSS